MWLFTTKNGKIKSIIKNVTAHPELWNKQLRDELIELCKKTTISKKTVQLLRKLIKKYPKIGGDLKMTLEQYLHSHPKEFNGLEQHTAKEATERSKAGLVPTLAMWGLSSLAAAYVSLFGIPTGNDAKYLNVPVAEAQEGMRLPDLSGAKYLGEKKKDKLSGIPGKESTLRGYQVGKFTAVTTFELPNGKIYGFVIAEKGKEDRWFWDNDADGIFEQHSKNFNINLKKYME